MLPTDMQLHQTQKIVCPTSAAQTLARNEGCETALYLSQILVEFLHLEHIPITCITDNKSLYDITNSLTSLLIESLG